MDALSEVLKAIRLDGAVYVNAEFTAPWCIEAKFGLDSAVSRLPPSEHVAFFHVLVQGSCKARLADGGDTLDVQEGDILLFPHDHLHLLGSDVRLAPAARSALVECPLEDGVTQMRYGGGGAATQFVCGYLACDRRICRPLFGALPRMLRVSVGGDGATGWLLQLLRVGVQESVAQGPGAHSLLAKLSELMFVEAMRRHALSLPADQKGWLAGLRDPYVGRALALLHGKPAHAWTVDALAREVALSRSALADRFVDLIGEPPMQYLTRWRLALAAHGLRTGNDPISRIAERCGYEAESAFNRAFKREFGLPPSAWRKQEQAGVAADSSAATPAF
jgi:AraC family transcriptional regulator, alkane utilization regulator